MAAASSLSLIHIYFRYTAQEQEDIEPGDIIALLTDRAMEIYDGKEQQYGDQLMRELERVVLLKTVDRYWICLLYTSRCV